MTVRGRWFVGPHAVARFIERSPFHNLTYEQALAVLVKMSERAHFIGRTKSGLEMWRGPHPLRMRFVVGPGDGELPAVRTVRPPHRASRVFLRGDVVVHALGDLESTHACAACGAPFVPRTSKAETCGLRRCRRIMHYAKQRGDEAKMAVRRARFTRWYRAHRKQVIAKVTARRRSAILRAA